MKSNLDTVRGKLGSVTQKITKGTRCVATATTLAVASLASQAQNPPEIPEIPTASIEKQNTYNALLSEGAKIGGKSVSGQTELFYSLQTSPGNYVVDISQWSGLSIPDDAKLKAKTGHFDSFLRSLVLTDAEFTKKKIVYIGMSGQAREALRLRIPEGMIDGYKIEIVYLPTTNDDGNKIVISVIEPDDGKFYEFRGKVYDYENTKSGLMTKLGGKQEVIDAIDSHPLRTIGAVSAGTLGVLALGGLAGAGLAGRGRKKEVEFWQERSKGKGFQMQLDELLRLDGIVFNRDMSNGVYTFNLQNRVYYLRSEYSLEEGGKIILESHGQYLKDDGHMHVIRGAGGNQPQVSLETFAAYLDAQLRESRTIQELEREQEGFVTELETFLRDGGIEFSKNGNGTYSFQDGSQRSYILIISTDGNRKVSFYDSTDGLHLDPSGKMVSLAEGQTIAGASFEVLKGYFQDHIFPGLSKVKDVLNHTSSLTDRTLVNLEVEDVATISDSLFSTLNKIDLIIQNQGFVGKLTFRTVKGSNNARMSRFKYGEKDCEIYVDDAGRVQVIVDNVSTPEGNETSPFEEVRSVIESIFSDD